MNQDTDYFERMLQEVIVDDEPAEPLVTDQFCVDDSENAVDITFEDYAQLEAEDHTPPTSPKQAA